MNESKAGRKVGSVVRRSNPAAIRRRLWQAMRIHRTFTVRDLVIAVQGSKAVNVKKWLPHLIRHGIVAKDRWTGVRGQTGSSLKYRLVIDLGPEHPTVCPNCGKGITAKECGGRDGQEQRPSRVA